MHEETMIVSSNDFVTIARAKIAHQRIITIGTTVIRFCESLPLVRRQLPDHDKLLLPDDVQYFRNTLTLNNYQQNQQCTIRKISDHQRSVETHIFITPARNFMIADIIMTNFHLPQTTLLVLVSSF
jgi:S-adenosylmethionine:tRNA-ribosyltransferase-isomerase (queuine synthetase)